MRDGSGAGGRAGRCRRLEQVGGSPRWWWRRSRRSPRRRCSPAPAEGRRRRQRLLKLGDLGAADLILYDGKISTVDKRNSHGRGDRHPRRRGHGHRRRPAEVKRLAARGTKLIDLNGRRVLPGLIDGHSTACARATTAGRRWSGSTSITKRAHGARHVPPQGASSCPTASGSGRRPAAGTSASSTTRRIFTFDELTAAAPKNPLWITGSGFQGPRVNQAALDLLGLSAGSPGVELGPDGKPTGRLTAPATTLANNVDPRRARRRSGSRARRSAWGTSSPRPTAAA